MVAIVCECPTPLYLRFKSRICCYKTILHALCSFDVPNRSTFHEINFGNIEGDMTKDWDAQLEKDFVIKSESCCHMGQSAEVTGDDHDGGNSPSTVPLPVDHSNGHVHRGSREREDRAGNNKTSSAN